MKGISTTEWAPRAWHVQEIWTAIVTAIVLAVIAIATVTAIAIGIAIAIASSIWTASEQKSHEWPAQYSVHLASDHHRL